MQESKNFPIPETPTPAEIVRLLDRDVVGQNEAKKAVAIALRNRWRRLQVEELKDEISPKNILMIGPTGVGKTEIARRIAQIVQAPFIKIEATKFTEIGYVGRDVDSIIRDLVNLAIKKVREHALVEVQEQARSNVEELILDALMNTSAHEHQKTEEHNDSEKHSQVRELYREKLRNGDLEDRIISVDNKNSNLGIEIMIPSGMEDVSNQLQSLFDNMPNEKGKHRKMKIHDARNALLHSEAAQLISEEQIKETAIRYVEEHGIVFLDEIDKVIRSDGHHGAVSREGVQRDLLPLIEGTTIHTKYGSVRTDHILFIASGAFMGVKPADMISELQGRLPIRVELKPLSSDDFIKILSEPRASLIKQYRALLMTEKVKLNFNTAGIAAIAEIAYNLNEKSDNIGARRLHTIMEKLLEEISFQADASASKNIEIDAKYVQQQLLGLVKDDDLSKWIL